MQNKPDCKRILITGINGFIGSALSNSLNETGYEVWGVDKFSDSKKQVIAANLIEFYDTHDAVNKIPSFPVIIHTAAIAHSKSIFDNKSIYSTNVKITENVLKAFSTPETHIIFLSSVGVYGEDGRDGNVSVEDDLRPSTYYGKSKMKCEEIIKNNLRNCDILRLSPVYDKNHLNDIRKRVFLPFSSSLKMIITPSPQFSLSNINTVIQAVLTIISMGPDGQRVFNIADPVLYSQRELSSWFFNREIIISEFFARPFYWLTYLLPKKRGYSLRCLYWKMFKSNIYKCNLDMLKK